MPKGRSKIDRLPEEVRDLIGRLLRQGRTLDEIMAKLADLDLPADDLPSRSGLGRWAGQISAMAEEMRRQETIGRQLVEQFGDIGDTRTARVNIAMAQGLLSRLMFTEGGGVAKLDAKEAMFVCSSISSLMNAVKADTDRQLKLQAEAEKKTKTAAVKAVDAVAKEKGLSADTIQAIKAQILGVKVGT